MAVAEKVPVPKTPRLRDRHLFPDALLNAELPLEKKEPVPLKRETRHEHDRIDMRAKPVAEPDPIELDAEDFESWIASQCQREFELIPQCDRFLSNRAEFEFVEIDIVDHVGGKKMSLPLSVQPIGYLMSSPTDKRVKKFDGPSSGVYPLITASLPKFRPGFSRLKSHTP